MEKIGDFLPTDYQPPRGGGQYMKFQKGKNRFRFLSKPIFGTEYWKTVVGQDGTTTRKPVRVRPGDGIDVSEIEDQLPKHFWAMVVWNYDDNQVQILEFTQRSIIDYVTQLSRNPKWGSPLQYDLIVNREGDGLETKYSVIADPKEDLAPEIEKEYNAMNINLDALYDGQDPFVSVNPENVDVDDIDLSKIPF